MANEEQPTQSREAVAGKATPDNERITKHLRNILSEVAPDRVDALLPVVERCVTQAITPRSRNFVQSRETFDTTAPQAGTDLIRQATELPFPEFVAKLITGTFDAIVASHIKQSEAYAQLVAELAKTIQQFEAANVTLPQVDAWLAENYPDGSGGTLISTTVTYDADVFDELVGIRLESAWSDDVVRPAKPDTPPDKWPIELVAAIRAGVRRFLARTGLAQLQAMARDGMQFVTVTSGEILARLTFAVTATSQQATSSSSFTQSQRGMSVGGSAAWRWLRISGGYSSSTLRVEAANKSTYSNVTMNAQLLGEVKLQFQTRTLPPIEN
jgi:hypothetical protein